MEVEYVDLVELQDQGNKHQGLRAFILERIEMLLNDHSGRCSTMLVEKTAQAISHPNSKRAIKLADRRPASDERWPIENRDVWWKGFDYTTLSDSDLVLFYERLSLKHWRQWA
jgi:hypothetical protein